MDVSGSRVFFDCFYATAQEVLAFSVYQALSYFDNVTLICPLFSLASFKALYFAFFLSYPNDKQMYMNFLKHVIFT